MIRISGAVPAGLLGGALYRNGPCPSPAPRHPLDRDGLVARVDLLGPRGAAYRSRAVETDRSTRASGGCFGGSCWSAPHNASNTGVLEWGGRVLSLYESGLPVELDRRTLATLGPTDLGGAFGGREAVAAHFRVDRGAGRLVMMSCDPLAGTVRFVEFDRGWNAVSDRSAGVGGYGFVHDFELAGGEYLFVRNGVRLDPLSVALGRSWAGCVRESGEPSRVVRLGRRPGGAARSDAVAGAYVAHFAGPEHVAAYGSFPDLRDLASPRSGHRPRVVRLDGLAPVDGAHVEFPSRAGGLLYGARIGRAFLDAVWRHDLASGETSVWEPGGGVRIDEPVVGPDGTVMVFGTAVAGGPTRLHFLDGRRPDMPEVARAELPERLPPGMHGFFRPAGA